MGTATQSLPVMLISGILAANESLLQKACECIEKQWGSILLKSETIPFDFTRYYNKEMGDRIIRCYIAFKDLIDPENIADIKLQTNRIESEFLVDEKRRINLDPGYVTLAKLVLATTKDATHRVYLKKGIYTESTLYFIAGSFCAWPWTYPDYQYEKTILFFNEVRNVYRDKIKYI